MALCMSRCPRISGAQRSIYMVHCILALAGFFGPYEGIRVLLFSFLFLLHLPLVRSVKAPRSHSVRASIPSAHIPVKIARSNLRFLYNYKSSSLRKTLRYALISSGCYLVLLIITICFVSDHLVLKSLSLSLPRFGIL